MSWIGTSVFEIFHDFYIRNFVCDPFLNFRQAQHIHYHIHIYTTILFWLCQNENPKQSNIQIFVQ